MKYWRVFFTFEGNRWFHDMRANTSESIVRQATKQGYEDVVVYEHKDANMSTF